MFTTLRNYFFLVMVLNLFLVSTSGAFTMADLLKSVSEYGKGKNAVVQVQGVRGFTELEKSGYRKGGFEQQTMHAEFDKKTYCQKNQKDLEKYLDDPNFKISEEEILGATLMMQNPSIYRNINGRYAKTFPESQNTENYDKYAEKIISVIPSSLGKNIDSIILYKDTRLLAGTAAVEYSDNDSKLRKIRFNMKALSGFSESAQLKVIVHELGHVLHGQNSQKFYSGNEKKGLDVNGCVDGKSFYDKNPVEQKSSDCYKKDSYLTGFFSRFYAYEARVDSGDKLLSAVPIGKGVISLDFVSRHARSRITEDFAESFAHYILELNTFDKNKGQARMKIDFFKDFTELVSMKQEFRENISKSKFCN